MSAFDWLKLHTPAFPDLTAAEREAITDFCVFWSLFELRLLDGYASPERIDKLARDWAEAKKVTSDTFEPALTYFKQRYFNGGQPTARFEHLRLPGKYVDRVASVLTGRSDDLIEIGFAVLMVTYRFRNNLFHGTKWTYWLQDQLDNFNRANGLLTTGLLLDGTLN